MVFTEGQTDSEKVKSRLKDIFPLVNVNERYVSFLSEYEDDRKSKYKLLMPHFTISTKKNKFIIKMIHFNKFEEIQIVSLLIKNIFEDFMVKDSTKIEQPSLNIDSRVEESNNSSNNESNNSNSNSSPKKTLVGLNSSSNEESEQSLSNSESESNKSIEKEKEEEGEIDISFGYEGKNYTSYMKEMRKHYDSAFFEGKEYTKKCRRQPYCL